jgi:CheY-like chemotaxis protein
MHSGAKANPKVILLADDDLSDIQAIQRTFKNAAVLNTLHAVHDGVEAIAYLQGQGIYADRNCYPYPGILLLDLKMPKKSGLEVLRWIRDHQNHEELGVIVLTAVDEVRQLREAYQLGAHSFLVKPLTVEELLNLVHGLSEIRLQSEGQGNYLDFDTSFINRPRSSDAQPA